MGLLAEIYSSVGKFSLDNSASIKGVFFDGSHHIKTINSGTLFTQVCLNRESSTKENPGHMHLSISTSSEFTHH